MLKPALERQAFDILRHAPEDPRQAGFLDNTLDMPGTFWPRFVFLQRHAIAKQKRSIQ